MTINVLVESLYNNYQFWITFGTYQYYVILQSVSKAFVIDDNMKLSILINIGKNVNIDYNRKKWIFIMFSKLNDKIYNRKLSYYNIFEYIAWKYDYSWSIIKPIINERSKDCIP